MEINIRVRNRGMDLCDICGADDKLHLVAENVDPAWNGYRIICERHADPKFDPANCVCGLH